MVEQGIKACTTAKEGRAFPSDVELYAKMAGAGELSIDVIAYPDYCLGRRGVTDEAVHQPARHW
jgi:hypothetical protein